jgi:integrase
MKSKTCPDCQALNKPIPPYDVRFRWIDETGHEIQKRLHDADWMTIKLAEKGKEKWLADNPENKTKNKAEKNITTFDEMYEMYLEHILTAVKESSYVAFKQRMDSFVVPYFKGWKMRDINKLTVTKWQDDLSQKKIDNDLEKNQSYSYEYKKAIRNAFYNFFEFAGLYGYNNPFEKVKGFKDINTNPEETDEDLNFWTEEEFMTFIKVVNDFMYKALFYIAYLTGARKGEYLSLKWKDIDFINHTIKINKTLSIKTINKKYKITTPKTKNSKRTVYLRVEVFKLLEQYKQTQTCENFSDEWFIFGGIKHIPFQTLTNRFNSYIKKAGVKQITVHELRHSCVSLFINKGGHSLDVLYAVAQHIGDTPEQVLKTYGHLFKSNKMNIIDTLIVPIDFCA